MSVNCRKANNLAILNVNNERVADFKDLMDLVSVVVNTLLKKGGLKCYILSLKYCKTAGKHWLKILASSGNHVELKQWVNVEK